MIHALSTPYSHGDAQRRSCRFRIPAHAARMSDVETVITLCHAAIIVLTQLRRCYFGRRGSGRGLPRVGYRAVGSILGLSPAPSWESERAGRRSG